MKNREVKQTLKKGVVVNTPYVRVYALLSPEGANQQKPQVAFVVSKKIQSSAVRRHKYQRWMREIIRQQKDVLPNNLMVVLMAKLSINEVKNLKQLQESFTSLLSSKKGFWDGS